MRHEREVLLIRLAGVSLRSTGRADLSPEGRGEPRHPVLLVRHLQRGDERVLRDLDAAERCAHGAAPSTTLRVVPLRRGVAAGEERRLRGFGSIRRPF